MPVPTDSLAKRLGVNVYQVPQNITPPPVTAVQNVCICGESAFVEDQYDTGLTFAGYHRTVPYKTSAQVTGGVIPSDAVLDLATVKVDIQTNSGSTPVAVSEAVVVAANVAATASGGNTLSGAAVAALVAVSGSDGVTDAGNPNTFTSAAATFTSGMVGKYLTFEVASVPQSTLITAFVDAHTLTVAGTFGDATAIAFAVSNVAVDQKVYLVTDSSASSEFTVTDVNAANIVVGGSTLAAGSVVVDIFSSGGFKAYSSFIRMIPSESVWMRGNILITFTAARHDIDGKQITVATLSDLNSTFGENALVPANKLGYALKKCVERTAGTYNIFGISVEADTVTAHQAAVEELEVKRNSYFIVPLSFVEEIGQLYKSFAEDMNAPLQRFASVVLWTPKLIYKTTIAPKSLTGLSASSGTVLNDAAVDFIELGIQPGQYINLFTGDDESGMAHPIQSVAAHSLTIDTGIGTAMPLADGAAATYEIISDFFEGSTPTEKNKQAEALFNYARSKQDAHFWINWPDLWVDNGVTVAGYFANAAYAGSAMVTAPQKPLNNFPAEGFSNMFHDNSYFKYGYARHIHQIESGGIAVATQTTERSTIRFEEQWTSDMSDQIYQYRSVVRNRDSVKMIFVTSLCPMMGKDNLTDDFLEKFNRAASSLLARLKYVGQVGRNATVTKAEIDTTDKTRLNVWVNLDEPYPAHDANVYFMI